MPVALHRARLALAALAALALAAPMVVASLARADCASSPLQLIVDGVGAYDAFGCAVAGIGDFNGDTFDDVIVGARSNDAAGQDAGRAYVFFGGPNPNAVADRVLTGESAEDAFGQSVAGAGDVNDDGFPDLIVGAPYNDAGGDACGRAYVYYGGPSADAVADLVLTGAAAGELFGFSVKGAGDVNGDGIDDVIVGAYGNNAGGAGAGRAYVFHGGAPPNAVADLILTGEGAGDAFGFSVSGAGDVNGDGFGDVVAGAFANEAGGPLAGRAYVFFGGAPANAVADLVLTGEAAVDEFGYSVSGAGDVNQDTFDDVVVGAPYSDAGGDFAGRAYVFFGGTAPNAVPDVVLTGVGDGDLFGSAVAGAGDVNGDSYADVLVGAYTNDAGGSDAGRSYLFFGGAAPDTNPDFVHTGEAATDAFGFAVSGAGDVDGDGADDLILGAPNHDPGATNAGRAYTYWLLSPDVAVDGAFDSLYEPAAVAVQTTQTSFGDSFNGLVDFCSGSELDQAFARLTPRALALLLAGNLRSDYKKLDLYFDTIPGQGQNRLRGDNPNIDSGGLNRMGDDGSGNGLRFDPGFAPDYYVTLTGGDIGGGVYRFYVNWAELLTNGGGLGRFLGYTSAGSNGILVNGLNPDEIKATIDNRNVAGVTAGIGPSSGAGVTTGVEVLIPLAAIGCPTGCVRVAAVVNGSLYDDISNQTLGPLPVNTPGLGEPRNVNFAAIPGQQYFFVCRQDQVGAPLATEPASSVLQTRPNPFVSATELRFALPDAAATRVDVYDVAGHHVSRVVDQTLGAGWHTAVWRGTDASGRALPQGIYYVRMESADRVTTGKVVKLR